MRIQHARVSQAISTGMSGLSASEAFQLFVHTLPGRPNVPLSFVYAVVGCTALVFSRTVRALCRRHPRTAYPTAYVVDSRLRSHRRRFFLQVHQLIEDILAECLRKTTICTAANRKRGGHALDTVLFFRGLLDGGG